MHRPSGSKGERAGALGLSLLSLLAMGACESESSPPDAASVAADARLALSDGATEVARTDAGREEVTLEPPDVRATDVDPVVDSGAGDAQMVADAGAAVDAGGAGDVSPAVDATPGGDAGGASFTAEPCRYPLPPEFAARFEARCGVVTVPEDRTREGTRAGRSVRLPVAVFSPRQAVVRRPDPVVYLTGGPGGPGVFSTVQLFSWFAPFGDGGRDVVAIDQRGTGRATPSLICGNDEDLLACGARLKAVVDLAQYNTVPNADDIEDVRRALGYGPWNLLGGSYGTRLALEVMRRHPAGVRTAILDSVAPPDFNHLADVAPAFSRTLTELEAACDRHADCARAYPRFLGRLLELARAYDADPVLVDTDGGKVRVDGLALLVLVRQLSYSSGYLASLPELVETFRERDADMLRTYFAREDQPAEQSMSDGMHYAVRCAEATLPVAPETKAAMALIDPAFEPFDIHDEVVESLCPIWAVPIMPVPALDAVKSDIPSLVLSGHFDPATPPAYAARVAATLTRASNHVLIDGSHGNFYRPCAARAVDAFLADPTTPPVWQCPTGQAQVAFVVPSYRLGAPKSARFNDANARALTRAHLRRLHAEVPRPPEVTRWR